MKAGDPDCHALMNLRSNLLMNQRNTYLQNLQMLGANSNTYTPRQQSPMVGTSSNTYTPRNLQALFGLSDIGAGLSSAAKIGGQVADVAG